MRTEAETSRATERRLTTCIAGLLSISASGVASRSDRPGEAIGTLLEVLISTLNLHTVHASFKISGARKPLTVSASSDPESKSRLDPDFRAVVDAWLRDRARLSPFVLQRATSNGERTLVLLRLGLRTQAGWLLACSEHADFPNQTERLLLVAAAGQATLSLEQANLLGEQTRLAQRLEQNVKLRTRELRTANAALAKALKQADTLRNALEKENSELRAQAAGLRGGLTPGQLNRAKALMSEDLAGRIRLDQIAKACNLSVRHFSRAFRQSSGLPPHQWLLNQRIERAKELLRDPKLSLLDIAIACGFGDQSHFSRAFSKMTDLSPGIWRRMRSTPQGPTSRPALRRQAGPRRSA